MKVKMKTFWLDRESTLACTVTGPNTLSIELIKPTRDQAIVFLISAMIQVTTIKREQVSAHDLGTISRALKFFVRSSFFLYQQKQTNQTKKKNKHKSKNKIIIIIIIIIIIFKIKKKNKRKQRCDTL